MNIFNTLLKVVSKGISGLSGGFAGVICLSLLAGGNAYATYDSSTTIQNTAATFPGMTNAAVVNLKVYISASSSTVTSIEFNTNGTTTASDLLTAKLYFTGTGGAFNIMLTPAQQVGSTLSSPNGTITFSGLSSSLAVGANNFWLVYDISTSATIGNSADAEATSITVDGFAQTPLVTSPTGVRAIASYLVYDYCPYPVTQPSANYLIGISRLELAGTVQTNIVSPSGNVQKAPFPPVKLYKDITYTMVYRGSSGNAQVERLFIDFNNDGFYDPTTEFVYAGSTPINATTTTTLYTSCAWPTGIRRARFATDAFNTPTPCAGNNFYGTAYELLVDIQNVTSAVAGFTKPDTAYTGSFVKFTNTSTGLDQGFTFNFQWDYKNAGAGNIDATTKDGSYQFMTPGTYTTKLRINRTFCGIPIADSITKTTVIRNPVHKPTADFVADRNITNSVLTVNLTDLSNWGPNKWHWKITPQMLNGNVAYQYVNGTDSTSQHPQVRFIELGVYSVSMFSENILGAAAVISKPNYISNLPITNACTSTLTSAPAGFLADDGGVAANYANIATTGRTCTYLVQPCASTITFNFIDLDISAYQVTNCFVQPANTVLQPPDNVKVWDGANSNGIPLHTAAGFPNGFTNGPANTPLAQLPPSVTAKSGSLYIEWFVNCAFNGRGFLAEWKSSPANVAAPVPSFVSADTAYVGVSNIFTNTSKGVVESSAWDFDNDGSTDINTKDADYTFTTTGLKTVKLTVERCGNVVSFSKNVRVLNQTTKPVARFSSTKTNAITSDTVRLIDESLNGATAYTWTITPSTGVTYVNGSNSNSRNPYLVFTQTGTYDIKLRASNSFGADSISKTGYINVFAYCQPNIVTLGGDIGISRVIIGTLDNSSVIGASQYTRYNMGTAVERGATYNITIDRSTNFNNINRKVWIDFNRNGSFADAGEEVLYGPPSGTLSYTGQITIPKNADFGNVRMRVGVSSENNSNLPCGPNVFGEFEDYTLNIIEDATIPVITLNGNNPLHIEQGVPFTDPGAIAMDNSDGNISSLMVVRTNLDTNVTGEYYISYNVTDLSGNKADSVVRLVIVEPDASGPVLTLLGGDTIMHPVKTTFTDPGATAFDYVDGNMSASITITSNVDTNIIGKYFITYNAIDLNGNTATKVRVVYVVDNIAPLISLNGSSPLQTDYARNFADPGTTVTDNYYTGLVTTSSSNVNVNKMGSYTVTYNVTDPSGNVASPVTRTVIVADISSPLITLLGADTITLDVRTKFNDPGTIVSDNHTKNLNAVVSSNLDTAALGLYTITYTATDSSGNTASINRYVRVTDRIKPVMTLKGSSLMNMWRWSIFADPGVEITDNFYSETTLQNLLVVSNSVDPNAEGLYEVCYNVTDPSGNKATQICRLVNVKTPVGVKEFTLDDAVAIYPNPNSGSFSIAWNTEKPMTIEIYDSYGALVRSGDKNTAVNNIYEVDLSNEAAGIYFVRLICGDEVITRRVSYQK